MELPLYQYHSLQPGYIRLLQFLPDGISRMRHVNLKNRSSHVGYAALSYTWGASTETFPFQCDAQNLPVRENLLHALSQLKNQIDTPIWIDAMCINQSDEVEKMSQLQMMTDIYRSANKVLIWLGKEIPEIK
ncbi:HET-domain-containing protein, partial [Lophium mytilinum]